MPKISWKMGVILVALIALSGCFSEGPSTKNSTQKIAFYTPVETDDFSIQMPEEWEIIEQFTSNYPANTVLAFRNNVKNNSFLANINIVRNEVPEGTLSGDYALQMFESLRQQIKNFKEFGKESIELATPTVTATSYIFEFKGTNDNATPDRNFIQIYGVKATKAYIVTGTYDPKDTELAIDQVKKSVKSFELK